MVKMFVLLSNKSYKAMIFIDRKLFSISVAQYKVKEFIALVQGTEICNLRTPVNL